LWNDLPKTWKTAETIDEFKQAIKSWTGPSCGCYICAAQTE